MLPWMIAVRADRVLTTELHVFLFLWYSWSFLYLFISLNAVQNIDTHCLDFFVDAWNFVVKNIDWNLLLNILSVGHDFWICFDFIAWNAGDLLKTTRERTCVWYLNASSLYKVSELLTKYTKLQLSQRQAWTLGALKFFLVVNWLVRNLCCGLRWLDIMTFLCLVQWWPIVIENIFKQLNRLIWDIANSSLFTVWIY